VSQPSPAVAEPISQRLAAAKVAARALCADANGSRACLCRGDESRCIAHQLWGTMASVVVLAIEKAGLLVPHGVEP